MVRAKLGGLRAAPPGILLVAALFLGALLTGCGAGEEEASGAQPERADPAPAASPPEESEAPVAPEGERRENVVVRVSGTPGTPYAGNYGNLDETQNEDYRVLKEQPVEYEVPVRDSGLDIVKASFVKVEPDDSILKVEILVDGEVVTESDTSFQYGSLNVTWSFGG